MVYVITCGDEGVQINEGTRLSVIGSGIKFEYFPQLIKYLKKLFPEDKLRIVSSQENRWIKDQFDLNTFEQADATMQQQAQALADHEDLLYVGFLPFADPKVLKHEVKGHMVRPKGVHIANKICFTLAGGEQTFNLGQYQISAEWLHLADKKIAKKIIDTQVDFYQKMAGDKLIIVYEEKGPLGEKISQKNKEVLKSLGY